MTSVKGAVEDDDHVALLMGRLFQSVRRAFDEGDWHGLRQSHFRVLSSVPAGGTSVTVLAAELSMSKQGCGQFVTFLESEGYLRVVPEPSDRRVRHVRRTPKGRAMVARVDRRMRRVEEEWAALVGPGRYRTFRRVLEELVAAQASER